MEDAEYTLTIPEAVVVYPPDDGREHVVYRVLCARGGLARFSSDHRYREFRAFHKKLVGSPCCGRNIGDCVLPKERPAFPGMLWGKGRNRDLRLLEARRGGLEKYMQFLAVKPLCQEHRNQFWRFVEPQLRNGALLEPVRGNESTSSFTMEKKSVWASDLPPGRDYSAYERGFAVQLYDQCFCRVVSGRAKRRGGGQHPPQQLLSSASSSSEVDLEPFDTVFRLVLHHTYFNAAPKRKSARDKRAGHAAKKADLKHRLADVEASMTSISNALARLLQPHAFPPAAALRCTVTVAVGNRPQNGWLLNSELSELSPVSDGSDDSFELISMPTPRAAEPQMPLRRRSATVGGQAPTPRGCVTRRGRSASEAAAPPPDPFAAGAASSGSGERKRTRALPATFLELLGTVWGMEHGVVPPQLEGCFTMRPNAPTTFACWSLLEGKYPRAFAPGNKPSAAAVGMMARDVIRWYNPGCPVCCELARKGRGRGGVAKFEAHQASTACLRRGSFEVQGARAERNTPRLHCDALSRSSSMLSVLSADGASFFTDEGEALASSSFASFSPTQSASRLSGDGRSGSGDTASLPASLTLPPHVAAVAVQMIPPVAPHASGSGSGGMRSSVSGFALPPSDDAEPAPVEPRPSLLDAASSNASLATGLGVSLLPSPVSSPLPFVPDRAEQSPAGCDAKARKKAAAGLEEAPDVLCERDPFWAFYKASAEYKRRLVLANAPPIAEAQYLHAPAPSKDPANLRKAVRLWVKRKYSSSAGSCSSIRGGRSTPREFDLLVEDPGEEEGQEGEEVGRAETWRDVFRLEEPSE